jgi:UDP-N-acetylmuramoyl-tripeptide--D-alanyl-D-alanine ligase
VPGPSGSIILDDTYNSSPTSCIAALNLLKEVGGRRIAILGGMFELGSYEEEGHKIVGRRACDTTDLLITVGPLGKTIGGEAILAGMDTESVYMVDSNAEAVDLVRNLLKAGPSGDRVLVKGSRGMEMEQIVAALQKGDPA